MEHETINRFSLIEMATVGRNMRDALVNDRAAQYTSQHKVTYASDSLPYLIRSIKIRRTREAHGLSPPIHCTLWIMDKTNNGDLARAAVYADTDAREAV